MIAGLVAAVTLSGQLQAEGFSAAFPGTVTVSKSTVATSSGQLTGTVYRSGEGRSVFQVMVTPLTSSLASPDAPFELLEAARLGAERAAGQKAVGAQNVLADGYPATRFAFVGSNPLVVLHLVAVARGRLYQATATVSKNDISSGVGFLTSFKLGGA